MRAARTVALLLILAVAVFWLLTRPGVLASTDLPADSLEPDSADLHNGEQLFWAGGCASCHAAPGAEGDERLKLGGGLELKTGFGLFRVPNISPDPGSGIGGWSTLEFVNAMKNGVSPDRRHYYPSFPYTSYSKMSVADLRDLKSYIDTLPAVSRRVADHEMRFPFNVRRALGLWKMLYLDVAWVADIDEGDVMLMRGRYLAEGPGHCTECHTPRGALGGSRPGCWLAGAPVPDDGGEEGGVAPNITPHGDGLADWSAADIAYYLESGFTPEFDSVGGSMVEVQENMAMIGASDREAIAAYLKALTAVPSACRDS